MQTIPKNPVPSAEQQAQLLRKHLAKYERKHRSLNGLHPLFAKVRLEIRARKYGAREAQPDQQDLRSC